MKIGPSTKVPLCYEKLFALHVRLVQNSIGNFLILIFIIITSPTYIFISFLYYYCIIYVVICNKQENYVLMKLDRQLKHQ